MTDRDSDATGLHDKCFACGYVKNGLHLSFVREESNAVSAEWPCDVGFQGYPGIIHGGVIATVLDAAMTNCLLMQGVIAVTADLHVEYRQPLRTGVKAYIKAQIIRLRPPLYVMESEIRQCDALCASAKAKFMRTEMWSKVGNV